MNLKSKTKPVKDAPISIITSWWYAIITRSISNSDQIGDPCIADLEIHCKIQFTSAIRRFITYRIPTSSIGGLYHSIK